MIRRTPRLEEFERELLRREPADYGEGVRVFEALYEEARLLGVFPLKDPLEGIEVKVRLARALNVPSAPC